MNAPTKAAIRCRDDSFTANNIGVFHDQLGDIVGMFDHVRGMTDNTGHENFVVWKLRSGPYAPVVTVLHVGCLDLITLHIHLQQGRQKMLQRRIVGMRAAARNAVGISIGFQSHVKH
jgi:hypothetical protein